MSDDSHAMLSAHLLPEGLASSIGETPINRVIFNDSVISDNSKNCAHNSTRCYIEMSSTLQTVQNCLKSFEITQGLLIVLFNAFVLGLIFSEKASFRRHKSNIHIVSLVCSDIIQGLINVPITVFLANGVTLGHPMCFYVIHLASTTGFGQIFIIIMMTIDRYWAIVHPLSYKTKATVRKSTGKFGCCELK